MANTTFANINATSWPCNTVRHRENTAKAGEAGIYPGMALMYSASDTVKKCDDVDEFAGVAGLKWDQDRDTVYNNSETGIPVINGQGVECPICIDDPGAAKYRGQKLTIGTAGYFAVTSGSGFLAELTEDVASGDTRAFGRMI